MDSEECFVCGVSSQRARLMDAISSKGIEKICEYCSAGGGIPVLRRPTTQQLKDSEKRPATFKEIFIQNKIIKEDKEKGDSETTLRDIVDRNYIDRAPKKMKLRPDLVDHFHWVIMRARRSKKLTHAQLAHEISESLAAIRMAEQGILPEDDYRLVNKLESFLGIKIVKDDVPRPQSIPRESAKRLDFDPSSLKSLTIEDLKKMKEEREKRDVFNEGEEDFD
ncbi:MAG: hypothetical protein KKC19_00715 [Nanoarchaeota archaeon]|nr:hypothetical protein [Nanoarchaeota archaeon]